MSNLYKRGMTVSKTARVIDYNDLIKEKLTVLRKESLGTPDEDGFIHGLQAEVVEAVEIDPDNMDQITEQSQEEAVAQSAAALEDAQQQVSQILADANDQAQAIITDANEQAQSIIQKANEDGYQQGSLKAQQELEQRITELNQEYEQKKQNLEQEYQEKKQQIEPELIEVLTEVFQKVTHTVAEDNQEIILHLIESVIKENETCKDFIIKVSPDDYRFVVNNQGKIFCAMSNEVHVDVVEDDSMNKNECIIETESGVFNCSLDIELNNLIKNIKLLSCI